MLSQFVKDSGRLVEEKKLRVVLIIPSSSPENGDLSQDPPIQMPSPVTVSVSHLYITLILYKLFHGLGSLRVVYSRLIFMYYVTEFFKFKKSLQNLIICGLKIALDQDNSKCNNLHEIIICFWTTMCLQS